MYVCILTLLSAGCMNFQNKIRISVTGASKLLANTLYSYHGMGLSSGTMIVGRDEKDHYDLTIDETTKLARRSILITQHFVIEQVVVLLVCITWGPDVGSSHLAMVLVNFKPQLNTKWLRTRYTSMDQIQ